MKEIILNDMLKIPESEYSDWTICLNNANGDGVYSFSDNAQRLMEHIAWKRHSGAKQSFRNINTKYCLQFQRLDKDYKWDEWLFLGAYEVDGYQDFDDGHQVYNLKPLASYSSYIERLIIKYKKHQGDKQAKIGTNLIETIPVVKILEKPYIQINKRFEGYNKVSLPFADLKRIINSKTDEWREVLTKVQCVYVITDNSNGKLYIGSTYGSDGIWQRWSTYVYSNGSGHNKDLDELIAKDPDYAFKNFQFTILEPFFNVDGNAQFIIDRETYWKNVLKTKEFGYNEN